MAWFKRRKGITTATEDKMDIPKGLCGTNHLLEEDY
jgi:hypothetical protein